MREERHGRRYLVGVLLSVFLLFALMAVTPVRAETNARTGAEVLPEEYTGLWQSLPDALEESLPPALFDSDPEGASEALQELLTPGGILRSLGGLLLTGWEERLEQLCRLFGILLLRAVWNSMAAASGAGGVTKALQLLARITVYGLVLRQSLAVFQEVQTYFSDLGVLGRATLPALGVMYAAGGNVATAAANHGILILTLAFVEWIGGRTVIPLFSLCLGFGILGAFGGEAAARMRVVTGKLKKWYTTALSLGMLLLSALLAAQNTLQTRADSLAFRTVRFAVSSAIPMVGGNVAEMLRTAAAGIGWMRGIVGIGGVVLILWLLVPTVFRLWLSRVIWGLAQDLAAWLGCPEEGSLLGEISSLYGYLLAVAAVSSMTFLFAFLLLAHCAGPLAG